MWLLGHEVGFSGAPPTQTRLPTQNERISPATLHGLRTEKSFYPSTWMDRQEEICQIETVHIDAKGCFKNLSPTTVASFREMQFLRFNILHAENRDLC